MTSEKLIGIAAVSQVRITRDDNFGVVAAERSNAGRFIVHPDEMFIAFSELEAAIDHQFEPEYSDG